MAFVENWDETTPSNSTEAVSIDDEIRKVKTALRERLAVEHNFKVDELIDITIGEHKTGSARVGGGTLANRPAVNSDNPGSVYVVSDVAENILFYYDNGTNWVAKRGIDYDYVNVKDFGADNTETLDSTENVRNAIATCISGDVLYFPNGSYKITEKINIPPSINVKMIGTIILYDDTDSITALEIGNEDSTNVSIYLELKVKNNNYSDWSNENNIGILLHNIYNSEIKIKNTMNFTIGCEVRATNSGCAYNQFYLNMILGNKIGLSIHSATNGWINENTFYNGRFSGGFSSNAVNNGKGRTGIKVYSDSDSLNGGYANNSNLFIKPSFELGDSDASPENATGIEFVDAAENRVFEARSESNTYGVIFRENSFYNKVNFSYGGNELNEGLMDNTITKGKEIKDKFNTNYSSENLAKNAVYYDGGTKINIKKHFGTSSGITIKQKSVAYVTIEENYLSLTASNRGIGFTLDTKTSKEFFIRANVANNNYSRISIRCFDQNGNILTDINNNLNYATGILSNKLLYYDSWLSYSLQADQSYITFKLKEEVKNISVIFIGGFDLINYDIYAVDGISIIPPFRNNIDKKLATVIPTAGTYEQGEVIYNDNPISGGNIGWVCTVAGTPGTWKTFGVIS